MESTRNVRNLISRFLLFFMIIGLIPQTVFAATSVNVNGFENFTIEEITNTNGFNVNGVSIDNSTFYGSEPQIVYASTNLNILKTDSCKFTIIAPIGDEVYIDFPATKYRWVRDSLNGEDIFKLEGGKTYKLKFKVKSGSNKLYLCGSDSTNIFTFIGASGSVNVTDAPAIVGQSSLNNFTANNSTTINDVINQIKNSIDSKYSVTASFTQQKNADESNDGYKKGNCTISYGSSSSSFPFTLVIPKLGQSAATVYTTLNNFCTNYNPTNNSVTTDFSGAVKITNNALSVDVGNWNLVKATDKTEGSIKCNVYVKENGAVKYTIPINKTIPKLAATTSSASEYVEKILKTINATNDLTEEKLLEALKIGIDPTAINVSIKGFNKTASSESTLGKIVGTVTVSDRSSSKEIPINLSVALLPQSVDTVKVLYERGLLNYVANNNTTEVDIKSIAYITNPYISVDLSDFEKIDATEEIPGTVKGLLTITDGTNTQTVPVNKNIALITQSLDTVVKLINNIRDNTEPSNDTDFNDLLTKFNSVIRNPAIHVNYSLVNPPQKVEATQFSDGSLKATLIATDGTETREIPIDFTISRLSQTANGIKERIEAILKDMVATNDTTEQDVIDNVETNIEENYKISFGADKGENFNKIKATESSDGIITGVIKVEKVVNGDGGILGITLKDEDIATVNVNLPITKLNQNATTLKGRIEAILRDMTATNDTTAQDVLNHIKVNAIYDENIICGFGTGEGEPFDKVKATDTVDGLITGKIYVSDSNETVGVDVNLLINKLNPNAVVNNGGSSSGSSGGGSSSSRHSSSNSSSSSKTKNKILLMKLVQNDEYLDVYTDSSLKTEQKEQEAVIEDNIANALGIYDANTLKMKNYSWDATNLNTGYLSKINVNDDQVGDYLVAENALGNNIQVQIKTDKNDESNKNIYVYNDDINKYILSQNNVAKDEDDLIKFNATNKKKYMVLDNNVALDASKVANQGWINYNGRKYIQGEDLVKNKWLKDNNDWYYMDNTGTTKTGWFHDDTDSWYFLDANGKMRTGWLYDSNYKDWYYLNKNGTMARNVWVDGYYVNGSGAWVR